MTSLVSRCAAGSLRIGRAGSRLKQLIDTRNVEQRGTLGKLLGVALITVAVLALLAARSSASDFVLLNSNQDGDRSFHLYEDLTAADVIASNTNIRNSCVANRAREIASRSDRDVSAPVSPTRGATRSSVTLSTRGVADALLALDPLPRAAELRAAQPHWAV